VCFGRGAPPRPPPPAASPVENLRRAAFLRAASDKAPATDKPTEAADTPEVVE